MSLKKYLVESEAKQNIPQAGDVFAIELEDGTLLETYIMSINNNTIVLDATPKMISVLREWADLEGEAGEVLFEGQFKQHMHDAAERMELDDFVERFGHMFSPGEAKEFWMLTNDVEDDAKLDETDYQTEIGIVDRGEYDQEGDMAKDDLATIVRAARRLTGMLDDNENMPEWVQSKINKAADYVDTAADYIESNKQGVAEDNSEPNPVARAVLNRMLMQHPGVIATHGPERVMNAIDELADYVNIGPDDEIGTSDVSGWTRDVIRMLAELPDEPLDEQGVAEGLEDTQKKIEDTINKLEDRLKHAKSDEQWDRISARIERLQAGLKRSQQGVAEGMAGMDEAKYQGREVALGKPTRGDVAKFKVYVRDPSTGNIKKVNFGHGGTSARRAGQKTMKIKKSDPARRRSFRARHNCDNPGPRTKARYWSCRAW